MHALGLSRSSPKGDVLPRLLRTHSPYLAGGYGEIENEIDNLDNLALTGGEEEEGGGGE